MSCTCQRLYKCLRDYQVQVHDAFLVLQPPVSVSASLRSLQCACKASAVQTARLNAPSKSERVVIACLRSMFSNSSYLSVQVCTISHHFHNNFSCCRALCICSCWNATVFFYAEASLVAADIMHFYCHLFPLQRPYNSGSVNKSFQC
jgi:hypothetical protein